MFFYIIFQYLADLNCPVENLSDKGAVVTWLLSRAVHLEFQENGMISLFAFKHDHRS